jgi:2-polyprenyl-6-methoxyphenol hydroxylase-like FAD-dependent oxidoreductase
MSRTASILIVGAGPTGLSLACELRRHGVACRVIDRGTGPTPPHESRALALWERTLEVFTDLGVIGPVLAGARRIHGLSARAGTRRLLHLSLDLDEPDTPYPFVLSLPQGDTERALQDRLSALGGTVERQTALTGLRQEKDRVRATVTGSNGAGRDIEADWLIGCDGPGSVVRHALNLPFTGAEYEERFLLADARLDWDAPDDEGQIRLLRDGGAMAAFPLPGEGRWRLIDVGGTVETEDPGRVADHFQSVLRANGHPEAAVADVTWCSAFRIHRRIAEHFRVGRCLLAGDAAHIHSPLGGQGMNTGIQDACNLAWKLALVTTGAAPEALLSSYEAERRPVAVSVLRGTDLPTRAVTLRHPVGIGARNALASLLGQLDFVRRRLRRALSELDIGYRDSPIVAEDRSSVLGAVLPVGNGPGLAAYLDFGAAPHAGDRAPDVAFADDSDGPERLFDAVRDVRHVLLLFEGAGGAGALAAALEAVGDLIHGRFAESVGTFLVGHPERAADLRWEGPRLIDVHGRLHRRFGAASPCLYLIRPDRHIGYRAQPPDAVRLAAYLRRLFG